MSLQVNDPRSRGRSKSPSGRSRERSKSRTSRVISPAPEPRRSGGLKKYGSDSADEDLRSTSRNPRSRQSSYRRNTSRYDVSSQESEDSGDERYRRKRRDNYAHSDVGDEVIGQGQKYGGRPAVLDDKGYKKGSHLRPPSSAQYESYSDSSDSADEDLAYGDLPGTRTKHRFTSSPHGSAARLAGFFKSGSREEKKEKPEEVPGSHPSYAKPSPFRYSEPIQPMQFVAPQPLSSQSDWAPIPECELPGFVPPSSQAEQAMPGAFPTVSGYPEMSGAAAPLPMPQYVNPVQHPKPYAPTSRPLSVPTSAAYAPPVSAPGHQRQHSSDASGHPAYANLPAFQYAQVDPNVKYSSKTSAKPQYSYSANPQFSYGDSNEAQHDVRYSAKPQYPKPASREQQYMEISPGNRTSGRPSSHSVSSANNLSVAGPDPTLRPTSPLQEPYKGTYQTISPMPSPIVVTSKLDDDVSDLEPLDASDVDRGDRSLLGHYRKKSRDDRDSKDRKSDRSKRDSSRVRHERHGSSQDVILISPSAARKRVSFYDPAPDAKAMQEALSHTRNMDIKTITRILPNLSSEEVLDLRKEYKNHVKLHGKGINVAKHLRLKLGTSAFGKVCYATALGRWESEAFWANCYYQSSTSRRELLIESLIGRENSEIREIKECFRDSRYMDSLEKCMKAELKADKFRLAVMLALEARRQSERDPIDVDLVQEDVQELHRALVSREGGETAMIYIIVRRSDAHLREVLRAYEKIYRKNFAKAMIAKSPNLVGETLAHILNGAINRPMRDALLLHQALHESRSGKERSELLISRLVRLHWEPKHLERVKREYRQRYGERVEEAIAEEVLTTSGGSDWGEFCIELARSSAVRRP